LTQHSILIACRVFGVHYIYDSDAAPWAWGELDVAGRAGDYAAIAQGIAEDINELRRRTALHGEGEVFGGKVVRVIEEYPSTAAELAEMLETADVPKDIGLVWLRRLLRRGRKYRMKVFAVAQEFEVNAWKIAGEGGLRRAFTVLYLGASGLPGALEPQGQGPARTAPGVFRSRPLPVFGGCEGPVLPGTHP